MELETRIGIINLLGFSRETLSNLQTISVGRNLGVVVIGKSGNTSNYLIGDNYTDLGIGKVDTLIGGSGAYNVYAIGEYFDFYERSKGDDYAIIINYNPVTDSIQVAAPFSSYLIEQTGSDALLFKGGELIAIIKNTDKMSIVLTHQQAQP